MAASGWRWTGRIDSWLHEVAQFLLSVPGQFLKPSIEQYFFGFGAAVLFSLLPEER